MDRIAGYDEVWLMSILRQYRNQDDWFKLVCWREKTVTSLWKWVGKFPRAAEIKDWNERLPNPRDDDAQRAWQQVLHTFEQENIIIVRHRFEPWEVDPATGQSKLCVQASDGSSIPLTELSPVVRSLRQSWMEDVQVHAFALKSAGQSTKKAFVTDLKRL